MASKPGSPLFSYMGTKRHLAERVVQAFAKAPDRGPIVDLFAGSGAVTAALSALGRGVVANDTSHFVCALQRAQLLPVGESEEELVDPREILDAAAPLVRVRRERYAHRVAAETRAMSAGPAALYRFMDSAPNIARDDELRKKYFDARIPSRVPVRHDMVVDYFGSRYFGTSQAIWLDAVREVVDRAWPVDVAAAREWHLSTQRDLAIGAWLLAAFSMANTPGHGAQYLRSTQKGFPRVLAAWQRDFDRLFVRHYKRVRCRNAELASVLNRVSIGDASAFVNEWRDDLSAAYADPPYTKDHYSRMYHLHETLYLYDAPVVHGSGLTRSERYWSPFSYKSHVGEALEFLVRASGKRGLPLVLSYPRNALLQLTDGDWLRLLRTWYKRVDSIDVDVEYSTLGGRAGPATKSACERMFYCSLD